MNLAICNEPAIVSDRPYRITVELLLYMSFGSRLFGKQLGVLSVEGLSGAMILASGLVCLVIILIRQESLPVSFLFAVLISLLATIVDLYLVDYIPRNMLFWSCGLLMFCYVARSEAALLRCTLFLATCVFIAVALGGTYFGGMQGVQRLGLEPGSVATMFGNPNDLAQISLITAVVLLFEGVRCHRLLAALCLLVALALSCIVLLTLSRQGLILLAGGLFAYLVVVMFTKARKFEATLLILTGVCLVIIFSAELLEIVEGYLFRLGLDSGRIDYWKSAPKDLYETLITGY